jgi:hypothetical protein
MVSLLLTRRPTHHFRIIADLLRLRSTNDLRQPFTSVKLMKFALTQRSSENRLRTDGPQSNLSRTDQNERSTLFASRNASLRLVGRVDLLTQEQRTIFD